MKVAAIAITVIILGLAAGAGYFFFAPKKTTELQQTTANKESTDEIVDFSKINSEFLFSAKIPSSFLVEYIPASKAIIIVDPALPGKNNLEKSAMYISFFKASDFLTLSTVDITLRQPTTLQDHHAILYEITKKDGVPNFAGQPAWRNATHRALDVRFSSANPTYFYSFAYRPGSEDIFTNLINSLVFHEPK